jgi:predicted ribosomally synthesized peptide with nif11-like leader
MEVNQKVKDFFMKLAEDAELREKLAAAVKCHDRAEWFHLSQTAGFDFARADREYLNNLAQACQQGELNEAQLEMVSGGVTGPHIIIKLDFP